MPETPLAPTSPVRVVIVTPALRDANNGNWQTAQRWARLLQPHALVRLVRQWPDGPDAASDHVMLALHARRSAASVAAWSVQRGSAGLAVVLTGTDLYRDIQSDADAQASLATAQALVVLQDQGRAELQPQLQAKARVIYQSTTQRQPVAHKPATRLNALMVGHLRAEKSPETFQAAARLLQGDRAIHLHHIGQALDAAHEAAARVTMAHCPRYRWWGPLPHGVTRQRMARAHVLVHCSRMEGGAHVIMEALASGTPVLASRVSGNVGMLGADYPGYFEWGDAAGLAQQLRHLHQQSSVLSQWMAHVAPRVALFAPQAEQAQLWGLVQSLVQSS